MKYFCIPEFTAYLDDISREKLFNDLNFTIQIHIESETSKNCFEMKLIMKIENFLREFIQ